MNIQNNVLGLILILSTTFCLAQSRENLEQKGGFQDIKLGTSPKSNQNLEFKKDYELEEIPLAYLYTPVKGAYERIGDIKVHSLEVWSFEDKIYEINIVTENDPRVFQGLEKAFGKAGYEIASDSYIWRTDDLKLSFKKYKRSKLQMVYHSNHIGRWVRESKAEKIESVAEDF